MSQNENLGEPLVKEVILDAPLSRVWKALTDKDELKQWCFQMEAFKPEAGFEFQFYGEKEGHKFLHLCKVLEVEMEKKMKWLWTYKDVPGDTYVTFELFPQGSKTKLRLTHEGLEKLPQDENYARPNFVEGWNEILGQLLPKHLSSTVQNVD
jgi:uncharacterized protein YndB with AHSA1/START domain